MNRNIIGIGEIGLDAAIVERVAMEKQNDAFEKQIEIAKEMEIPIVVHARKAIDAGHADPRGEGGGEGGLPLTSKATRSRQEDR